MMLNASETGSNLEFSEVDSRHDQYMNAPNLHEDNEKFTGEGGFADSAPSVSFLQYFLSVSSLSVEKTVSSYLSTHLTLQYPYQESRKGHKP
jgi:hypothetical protein